MVETHFGDPRVVNVAVGSCPIGILAGQIRSHAIQTAGVKSPTVFVRANWIKHMHDEGLRQFSIGLLHPGELEIVFTGNLAQAASITTKLVSIRPLAWQSLVACL